MKLIFFSDANDESFYLTVFPFHWDRRSGDYLVAMALNEGFDYCCSNTEVCFKLEDVAYAEHIIVSAISQKLAYLLHKFLAVAETRINTRYPCARPSDMTAMERLIVSATIKTALTEFFLKSIYNTVLAYDLFNVKVI